MANVMEIVRETLRDLKGSVAELKKAQESAVISLLSCQDVLAVLPTGFGKSLIFQVYVRAKGKIDALNGDNIPSKILVVFPLVGLIEDQKQEAKSLGITCASLKELNLKEPFEEQMIFATAEEVIEDHAFRQAMRENESLQRISAVVVDESHVVETWTGKRKSDKKPQKSFRGAYGELAKLRSWCKEGIPLIALTGTADESTIKVITESLAMKPNYIKVFATPNRENLRINVIKTTKQDMVDQLNWIVNLIQNHGVDTPKIMIFCNTLKDVATVVNDLMMKLGRAAYHPQEKKTKECCLIGIYHALSWENYKHDLITAFKGNTTKRLLVATTALSMGINFPDVRYIVNWGPARSLLDHHQEAGRAGRDGKQSDIVVIYHGHQLIHCEQEIKDFVKSNGCLRVASFKPLDKDITPLEPSHNCCSNCRLSCSCTEKCSAERLPFEQDYTKTSDTFESQSRAISPEDKSDLTAALQELQLQESNQEALFDGIASHGFSAELITDIVQNCASIYTLEDITQKFPVFSFRHAFRILEIFHELFDDIPHLQETVDLLNLASPTTCESVNYYGYFDSEDETDLLDV